MKRLNLGHDIKFKLYLSLLWILVGSYGSFSGATPLSIADSPLFLSSTATPIVMLDISTDHQLYFKAYDDFSDLNGNGVLNTTYTHSFTYYGYFDSYKCYAYNTTTTRFEPSATTTNKYCVSGLWSGNFLNWASMTRIDTVRKILYGGYRSTDTGYSSTTTGQGVSQVTTTSPGLTVLERSYLPNDGHSFAKFYNGSDLPQLTPYTTDQTSTGITLCNTTYTTSSSNLSQNITDPPLIRVAKGDFSLWAANERSQCLWYNDSVCGTTAGARCTNGNVSSKSGLNASGFNPTSTSFGSSVATEFNARVKVCVNGLIGTENCKVYPDSTLKPVGLLQTYGDNNQLRFGLMTGSYGKNKSGGVLRKNVSSMNNEINVSSNGTFIAAPSGGGIINALNTIRIYGYRHNSDGTYFGVTGSANCSWGLTSFTDGNCNNWGNPVSEIYLESLRYLAGKSASTAFASNDSTYFSSLGSVTPVNPVLSAQWCAKLNVIDFNSSSSSYDGDQLGGISDISSLSSPDTLTNTVGAGEKIDGHNYFVGSNGTTTGNGNDQLCTAKTVSNLSSVTGTCPDAPRLSGTYQIAGLAWYGHTNDLQTNVQGKQTTTTYGVTLSPRRPKVVVPVPGTTNQNITILPACQDASLPGNCTLMDFKVVNNNQTCSALITAIGTGTSPAVPTGQQQTNLNTLVTTLTTNNNAGTLNCGKIYVNWEDSEQGGDFDMDMWGVLTYFVTSNTVYVATQTIYQSTPYHMGLGYVISGTTKDGFHVHSGINGYAYSDSSAGTTVVGAAGTKNSSNVYQASCVNCVYNDSESIVSYTVGTTSASSLQDPLWYSAKWGGFNDYNNSGKPDSVTDWDVNRDGNPDLYFSATNPTALATSLQQVFNDVIGATSSASAAAANSTSLQAGTVLYQAQFSSTDWSGHLYNFTVQPDGTITDVNHDGLLNGADANWDAGTLMPEQSARNIYTYNGTIGTSFIWPTTSSQTLTTTQSTALDTLSGVTSSDSIGSQRLNWLRGDTSKETRMSGGIYRNRVTTVLGDIINSDPVYTQAEDFGYTALPLTATEQASYATYVAGKSTRIPMIYDGSNDGMLHGFRADVGHTNSGVEQFAYVPAAIYSNLSSLSDPAYLHKYYVDGSPTIGDAYLSGWKTILLGGLNKGGKGIYALDVSTPASFSAANVLWDYSGSTSDTGSTGVNDNDGLGLTYAQPQVARMNDGSWVAIFGNGYNSTSEKAFLYIVNLSTGNLIKKIPTSSAVSNGLSTAVLYDANNDSIIDYAYAGDLQGNLWKFDLSSTSSSGWKVANEGRPLFIARYTSGSTTQVQPITSKPAIGANPMGGVLVYFGTGSYLTTADVSNTNTQTFYAIWDKPDSTATVTRDNLVQQTITETVLSGTTNPNANCPANSTSCISTYSYNLRGISTNTVDFNAKRGWKMNLTSGERVVSAAVVKLNRILFLTNIPSTDPCVLGGTSWLMELDMLSGGAASTSPFDLNNDNNFNSSDALPDGTVAGGVQSSVGTVKSAVWLSQSNSTVAYKEMSGSSGKIMTVKNQGNQIASSAAGTVKRLYWLQIQ